MKILFIASKKNVGLSFHFTCLALALKKMGNRVIVVSSHKQEEKGLSKKLANAKVKHYKLDDIDNINIKNLMVETIEIGKIIDKENVDIIHANSIRHLIFAFLASKIFAKKKTAKIVVTIHSILHGTPYEKPALLIESFLINLCADLTMPVAKSVARKLVKYGTAPNKILPVYNGVDLKMFKTDTSHLQLNFLPENSTQPSLLISYFAELVPRKGHKYLIEAFSKVLKELPNAKLILTGNGPLKNHLKNLTRAFRIENDVIFTGKIKYKTLYQLLEKTDIFAFPSLSELFPHAILEAMAAGKPIVATNVGGIPEIIKHEENGILVPPKDSAKLAEAIKILAKNPKKARIMGEKNRRLVDEKFSLDKIAEDITSCYRLTVGKVEKWK